MRAESNGSSIPAQAAAAAAREACLAPLHDLVRLRQEIEESGTTAIESATRRGFWLAGMFLQFLETQSSLVDGAGFALAPETFDDGSHGIGWWRRDEGGHVTNVAYDFNPGSINYYDYASRPWFRTAQTKDRPVLIGPYVDAGGLDTSTVTLAAPVHGATVHVIGCDISLAALEAVFVRAIGDVLPPLMLVGSNRRVLASNTARYSIGALAPRSADPGLRVFRPEDDIDADWEVRPADRAGR
ncbi:hypothetical protein BN12_450005 [Nostocoides japonicum T1-X7]|uniref:Cache domain-containing protein n=1 Tax=Nostocoides japonicum T1-X7 TaxID=1194083 RepID=A0A077M0Z2_9MICO|nr:cache domain-containing protein [Tetrasphaera japonica]CCH79501.1 hypothetical protein BN12_450005 [Tetrasphaera japonica T1-X7]